MNILIVDDEFLARKLLASHISKMPGLTLLGQCANAVEAFDIIQHQQVDILLLDIHMPDINGLQFARVCSNVPAIIFTTAYSEYALDSYELAAVDYLLKPIAFERLQKAIDKAKEKIEGMRRLSQNSATTPTGTDENTAPPTATDNAAATGGKGYMMVKADYRLYKINYDDLLYVEGQHEYVSFYTTGKRITALYALKTLEEQLPGDRFIRVHKSYIVNLDQVSEMDQNSVTVAGQKIPVGGSYREALNQKLGIA